MKNPKQKEETSLDGTQLGAAISRMTIGIIESGIRDVHAENRYVTHIQLIQLALNYKQTFFQICT